MIFDFVTWLTSDEAKNTAELTKKISEVHKQLFPKATFESQCKKFEEECVEFQDAVGTDKNLEELADMLIVACGIKNFGHFTGTILINNILDKVFNKDDQLIGAFLLKVCEKMNKNQERIWNEEKGYYKHKDSVLLN